MHDIVSHPTKPNMRFTGRGHYQDEYRLTTVDAASARPR
jgi:hypothetical protein